MREVPGGAETLGLAASEPVVPGQTAGWGRSQHLDGLSRHRLGAGGEILIDLRLELGQNLSTTIQFINPSSPRLRPGLTSLVSC